MAVYTFTYKTSRNSADKYAGAQFIKREEAEKARARMKEAGFIVYPIRQALEKARTALKGV